MRRAAALATLAIVASLGLAACVPSPTASPTNSVPVAAGYFIPTGWMASVRDFCTATLLPDGQVLVAGGSLSNTLASAELYDPESGTFSPTGPMTAARFDHTATLLLDGLVLIAGGSSGGALGLGITTSATAELYDPETGSFSPTGSMSTGRDGHTATLLPDGRVLIVGGSDGVTDFASAELYDPKTGSFSPTGSMATARQDHTATLLADGRVLIAGGYDTKTQAMIASAETYDPNTAAFSATGSLETARADQTATLLPDHEVLMAGGGGDNLIDLASAELYQP